MTRNKNIYKTNLHILFTFGEGLIFCFLNIFAVLQLLLEK